MADAALPLAAAPAPGVRDGQITISQLVDAYMAPTPGGTIPEPNGSAIGSPSSAPSPWPN
jgi:hypothetical protein